MKKWAALLLLFCAGFSIHAQIHRDATIYLPPVTGTGANPGDNDYISNLIIAHIEELNYLPLKSRNNAAFTLSASIAPQNNSRGSTGAGGPSISILQMYILKLELKDNRTGGILISQVLYYSEREEIADLIVLNFGLLPYAAEYVGQNPASTKEPEKAEATEKVETTEKTEVTTESPEKTPDDWRNKPWYLGVSIFWAPRVYEGKHRSTYFVNFGYGLTAEYHFLNLAAENRKFLKYLSVGTSLELVPDWVVANLNESYRDLLFEISLVVSFDLKPSNYFMLMPYTGINFNIPLYRDTIPPPVAWRLGFQYGIKVGPGVLVIDPWFSMDFGSSSLEKKRNVQYQRYMVHVGVKYKYGFDNFRNFLWFKQ